MRSDLEGLHKKWQECKVPSITIEAAFAWLFEHLEYAGENRCLIHGDLRFHNVLVDGGALVAILDWELAAMHNPGFDLAYAYSDVTQLVSWQRFLSEYASAGGLVPSQETLSFYLIRTELFIAVNMSKIASAVLAGALDNIHSVYGGIAFTESSICKLAGHLHNALGASSA
jgi:aminoglycoside phosphotransferase (APT) family kinase protein